MKKSFITSGPGLHFLICFLLVVVGYMYVHWVNRRNHSTVRKGKSSGINCNKLIDTSLKGVRL